MSKPLILEHEDFIKNIIQSIEDQAGVFSIGNVRIEYGILKNLTVPASGYNTVNITFSKAFTTIPAVFLQARGNYNIKPDLSSNSSREAIVNLRSLDGYERKDRTVYWFAIGRN